MDTLNIKRAPKTRQPRIGRLPLIARVTAAPYSSREYRHPTLEIGYIDPSWGSERFVCVAEIRFQQHLVERDRDSPALGFLRDGRWSLAYGQEISAKCEYPQERRQLRKVLDLLDRAEENLRDLTVWRTPPRDETRGRRYAARSCQLLMRIVALRHAGVPVTVYRPERRSAVRGGYGSLAVAS